MTTTAVQRDEPGASSRAPAGLLRINATLGFGRRFIAPALSEFACLHSTLDLLLHLSEQPLDPIEHGFDVTVRIGAPADDERMTCRRLRSNRRVLCAAPAYLKQRGLPLTLADLSRHQAILLEEDDQPYGRWRLRRGDREQSVDVHGAMYTNDGEAAVRWALDGLGILLRSEWDIGPDVKAGRLVVIVPEWSMPADVCAVYRTDRGLAARTQLFVDFLAARIARA